MLNTEKDNKKWQGAHVKRLPIRYLVWHQRTDGGEEEVGK